jgi:hypothetical protein
MPAMRSVFVRRTRAKVVSSVVGCAEAGDTSRLAAAPSPEAAIKVRRKVMAVVLLVVCCP